MLKIRSSECQKIIQPYNKMKRVREQRKYKPGLEGEKLSRERRDTQISINKKRRDQQLQAKRVKYFEGAGETLLNDAEITQSLEILRNNANEQGDQNTIIDNLNKMRNLLSSEEPRMDFCINQGCIALFKYYLENSKKVTIQALAAWCLTNLGTGNHSQTELIIECTPLFIELICSDFVPPTLKEPCSWVIGNLSGCCQECRTKLRQISSEGKSVIFALAKLIKPPPQNNHLHLPQSPNTPGILQT